jgi:hypothetical protein
MLLEKRALPIFSVTVASRAFESEEVTIRPHGPAAE